MSHSIWFWSSTYYYSKKESLASFFAGYKTITTGIVFWQNKHGKRHRQIALPLFDSSKIGPKGFKYDGMPKYVTQGFP